MEFINNITSIAAVGAGIIVVILGGSIVGMGVYRFIRKRNDRPLNNQELWAETSEEAKDNIIPYLE